jgi:hypothetical protein
VADAVIVPPGQDARPVSRGMHQGVHTPQDSVTTMRRPIRLQRAGRFCQRRAAGAADDRLPRRRSVLRTASAGRRPHRGFSCPGGVLRNRLLGATSGPTEQFRKACPGAPPAAAAPSGNAVS